MEDLLCHANEKTYISTRTEEGKEVIIIAMFEKEKYSSIYDKICTSVKELNRIKDALVANDSKYKYTFRGYIDTMAFSEEKYRQGIVI